MLLSSENPGEQATRARKCHVFLFNDMLLLAKKTSQPPTGTTKLAKMAKVPCAT